MEASEGGAPVYGRLVARALPLFVVWMLAVVPGAAAERVALVIGNGDYAHVGPLPNPVNDAADVSAALRGMGFAVTLVTNANIRTVVDALEVFRRRSAAAEVALVFYAGHGIEVGGRNYLIPVDAELARERDVRREAVSLDEVVGDTEGARLRLVILDACRENPFTERMAPTGGVGRTVPGGLAAVTVPQTATDEMLVALATAPGAVAADGEGRNSPFTAALLQHLEEPGVDIELLFRRVTQTVLESTNGRQRPWVDASLLREHYLVEPVRDVVVANEDPATERVFWESIRDSEDPADYVDYLRRWPDGTFASLARRRSGTADAALAPAPSPEVEAVDRPLAAGDVLRDCPECPALVVVPAGGFMMGSPASEGGQPNEWPQHQVRLGEPLAVGVYEVTFDEWDACVSGGGCNGYRPPSGGWGRGTRPVVGVNWEDAESFVRWLSRATGYGYRLLSEAEWEYAARAGTTEARYWDPAGAVQCRYANGDDDHAPCPDGYPRTAPVGSYEPNGFGLHDMLGNVFEWTQDCWDGLGYAGSPTDGRAWEAGECVSRVVRGGAWSSEPRVLRAAFRGGTSAVSRVGELGFRVVRTLD